MDLHQTLRITDVGYRRVVSFEEGRQISVELDYISIHFWVLSWDKAPKRRLSRLGETWLFARIDVIGGAMTNWSYDLLIHVVRDLYRLREQV
jgi:hypothetical protein